MRPPWSFRFRGKGHRMRRDGSLIIPVCALFWAVALSVCASGAGRLWLDRGHTVVDAATAETFVFDAGAPGADARPTLWIAARCVYDCERSQRRCMALTLNGTPLGLDRLAVGAKEFTLRCYEVWPIPRRKKCELLEFTEKIRGPGGGEIEKVSKAPLWAVRLDDNFVVGEGTFLPDLRTQVADNVEPSLALDLTGLIRPGRNTLEVRNAIAADKRPLVREESFRKNPPIPPGALHAKFIRVGLIGLDEIRRWNAARTLPYEPRPLTFNLRTDEGFRAMRAYYEAAAGKLTDRRRRAVFRFLQGPYELFRGDYAGAEATLAKGLGDDCESEGAARALFFLGLAQLRQGKDGEAEETWSRLEREFPYNPWTLSARRERLIRSWKGRLERPVNWPCIEAPRIAGAIKIDGALDEREWKNIKPVTDLQLHRVPYARPGALTEVRVCYDDRNFYLGMVCHEPFMDEVRNPHVARDSDVWADDCIELFIDPERTWCEAFEFELGVEGGILDTHNIPPITVLSWNPVWSRAVKKHADRWVAEIAIPWKELETDPPAPGDVGLCNIIRARTESRSRPEGEAATLGLSTGWFKAPQYAAMLLFR